MGVSLICFSEQLFHRTISPLVTNGLSHPYLLDESSFILRGIGVNMTFSFFDENHFSKQNSPRWRHVCGVKFGAILWA